MRIDLRPERLEVSVQDRAHGAVTSTDTDLAHRISVALAPLDLTVAPARTDAYSRPVAGLEVAIDALNSRPFWRAVLGYVDDAVDPGPSGALVDPAGQQPTLWFQQMDQPRNHRIHLDITVSHDEAEPRVRAALAAGGRLINASYARMFRMLADAEGNECCSCTWTDRDEWTGGQGETSEDTAD